MAWRILALGDRQWNVSMAAERGGHSERWRLVLSFRQVGVEGGPLWADYPLESASRSSLFHQADQIPNERLAAVLAEHLR